MQFLSRWPVPSPASRRAGMADGQQEHWSSNGQENGENGYSSYSSGYRENGYHGGAAVGTTGTETGCMIWNKARAPVAWSMVLIRHPRHTLQRYGMRSTVPSKGPLIAERHKPNKQTVTTQLRSFSQQLIILGLLKSSLVNLASTVFLVLTKGKVYWYQAQTATVIK